jgi:hypothetical protein
VKIDDLEVDRIGDESDTDNPRDWLRACGLERPLNVGPGVGQGER